MWILQIMEKSASIVFWRYSVAVLLFHMLTFQWPLHHGLKWKDLLWSWGHGDRAGVPYHPRLMLLCSSHVLSCLSNLCKGLDLGAGEGVKCPRSSPGVWSGAVAPDCSLLASLLQCCLQGQPIVSCRMLCPSAAWPQELNIWPQVPFWQDMGPQFLGLFSLCMLLQLCLWEEGEWVWGGGQRQESVEEEMCSSAPYLSPCNVWKDPLVYIPASISAFLIYV